MNQKYYQANIAAKILILLFLIQAINALTDTEISQKCHCDITSSFCDFGCCCDTDCGTSFSESCFYSKSEFYCPKTQFFKSIKPGVNSSNICYYYNASSTTISEQTLSSSQRSQLLSTSTETTSVSSSIDSGYQGYKVSTLLSIGGKSSFSFVDGQGNCLSTAQTSIFSFKFGQNTKISCVCSNCGTPLLFSQIMGQSISQFYNIASNNLTIPSVSDSAITTFKINFIIGKYGSQKVKFIDKITYTYESDGSSLRNLYLNFIDSDNIKVQQNSASFFPQIPLDMFYPIHIMS